MATSCGGAFIPPTVLSRATRPQNQLYISGRPKWNCCAGRSSMPSRQSPEKRPAARRAFLQTLLAAAPLVFVGRARSMEEPSSGGGEAESGELQDIDPGRAEPEITDEVYLDLSLDGGASERVRIGLYGDVTPATVANFKALVTGGAYVGTRVYRVVPGLTVQLGDVLGNGGKTGRAATGDGTLARENVRVKHSVPGLVSMATDREGRVDSRFFVNTRPGDSGYLDGRYCAFGRVVDNMGFLYRVERAAGKGAFASRLPKVEIVDAGVLPVS